MLTLVRARASHLAAVSAVISVVTLAGCGSVAPVDTFEVRAAPLSAEQACAASAATLCEHARSCSSFLFDRVFTSVATCAASFTEQCVDQYRGEGTATEIADCSAAVSSVSCERLLMPITLGYYESRDLLSRSCPVTPGRFGDGERCLRDGDCATGRCAWQGECGKCVAPRPPVELVDLGQPCTANGACLSRWCAAGRCSPPAELGEACGERPCDFLGGLGCGSDQKCRSFDTVPVGQECSWLFDLCGAGAVCESNEPFGLDWRCKKLPSAGPGEPCTFGCSPQLSCVSGRCAATTKSEHTSCATAASPK